MVIHVQCIMKLTLVKFGLYIIITEKRINRQVKYNALY